MGCCSPPLPPPHPPSPAFNSSQPARQGGMARRVGAWGRCSPEASWGQEPQTSVFISSHHLHPALGVSARKARGRGGDPKSSHPGQATPWHPRAGRVGHTICESRSFPLPSAQTAPWAPHLGVGRGGWLADHPLQATLFALSCLLLLGTLPLEDENSQLPGSHPEATS